MMHISGKIMIPIGIVFIILSGILIATIDSEEHIQKLDQDGYLIIDFYQDDQDGEKTKTLGFSFWIEGEYIDADGNGLWDACEEFNASVTGPPGHPDADTERFQLICDEKDEEWNELGLIKVGQACNSEVKRNENGTLEVDSPMGCPDGEYRITANSDARVIAEDERVGAEVLAFLLAGCGCCLGLITILLGIGFGFSMQPSPSAFATMEFAGGTVAPLENDGGGVNVPGTVPGAVFGAGPPAQITDTPASEDDAEEIQSAADSLKTQFLAGAPDKVEDAGEPEKE